MTLRLTNVDIVSYIYYSSVHTGRALGFVHRIYDQRGGAPQHFTDEPEAKPIAVAEAGEPKGNG
jgi:hypothetical protein